MSAAATIIALGYTAFPRVQEPAPTSESSALLSMLADGPEKRQFILDCTGCHQIGAQQMYPFGKARTRAEWVSAIHRMQSMAGPETGFPVMGPRDAERTAAWLSTQIASVKPAQVQKAPANPAITEFSYPEDRDLPHDLGVMPDGRIAITGMLTHQMMILDPRNGRFTGIPIPIERANPRSLEIGSDGSWYIALGAPRQIARYQPSTDKWSIWDIGHYAHEARYDGKGRLWFNDHFSRAPVKLGYVDVATGKVTEIDIPTPAAVTATNPVPYGVAIAPDGSAWGNDLRGNRIYRVDAATGNVKTWDMPAAHSGPRRPDFDASGKLWIPEYSSNRLTRFDPATETFRSWSIPVPDALPYTVRVNRRNGVVWIGTGAADALIGFDPLTETFAVHRLPTAGALVREIAVDTVRNEVWAAYGASPGIAPRIARLRLQDRVR